MGWGFKEDELDVSLNEELEQWSAEKLLSDFFFTSSQYIFYDADTKKKK